MLSKTLTIICLLSASLVIAGDDTPETRRTAAQSYLSEVALKAMKEDLVQGVAASVPEAQRPSFSEALKGMDWKAIEQVCLEAMVKTYNTEEIKAMHKFYGTEVGRSVQSKLMPYMNEIMGPVQQQIQTVMMAAMQKQQEQQQQLDLTQPPKGQ